MIQILSNSSSSDLSFDLPALSISLFFFASKDPADYVLSKFNNDQIEEVEFIIEDSMEIIDLFFKDLEFAIKKASERRIIDVV